MAILTKQEVLLVIVAKFIGLIEDKEKVKQKAKEKGVDPEWFLSTFGLLKENCEAALASGGALVTLFE